MEKKTRIISKMYSGKNYLYFQIMNDQDHWITIGGTGIVTKQNIWFDGLTLVDGSPQVEWDNGTDELQTGIVSAEQSVCQNDQVDLCGVLDCHHVRQSFSVRAPGRIHVEVSDQIAEGYPNLRLSKLMSSIYFFPEEKIARTYDILDFAWLPNIHTSEMHVCGDHFFRSPIVAVAAGGFYLAIVPDLDIIREHRTIRQAMDLHSLERIIEAPSLSYGICHWEPQWHTYTRHEPQMLQKVTVPNLVYGFDVLLGTYSEISEVSQIFTEYLWKRYGERFVGDVRPQVLPFEEYGRRYTYHYELPDSIESFDANGKTCIGIYNANRRGANFHAWENDLVVDYGIRHYAEKWNHAELRRISDGIVNLYKSLPRQKGAFPCIYNFDEKQYEGTLFWTARATDPIHGYDTAAMSTSVWWSLNFYEDCDEDPELLDLAVQYAKFLLSIQTEKGAIPTYLYHDLKPARQLAESGTTALNAAVLARVARLVHSEKMKNAAICAGEFVFHMMVEDMKFFDFETIYSCSPHPLYAVDYWTGIKPQCTLSILWGADLFLELYRLTENNSWLQYGEHLLRILCLYQQVWDPSFFPEYLFGGFGCLNTDAEWNENRQQRIVPTLVNYYLATGKKEFMERAVAACRAAFALMDMKENHANKINNLHGDQNLKILYAANGKAKPGQGYAPENIHHHFGSAHTSQADEAMKKKAAERGIDMKGFEAEWTGMTWSSGGALAASAYLEKHVGNVCVDLRSAYAFGIDGVQAELISAATPEITVRSQLSNLPLPYCEPQRLIIQVLSEKKIGKLIVNGAEAEPLEKNRFAFSI
ncbi:hypothetical protein [Yeguia hominis]|uniref:Uncharacterized protein n=1 Tax=Yeguia hominis TaxID=2763662 RepID=A0A926D9C0_9FIRM|nr:hypothetical protein [Yeguia hominis]MBC8533636.1 hypothetical protein [Yeguia hominis]